VVLAGLTAGCFGDPGVVRASIHDQRLASGKVVKVVSCVLAWGVEHDERFPDRDAFAIEYLSEVPRETPERLEREALEVFELIRPLSEQWGLPSATVTALRSPDHTGTWDVFSFQRSPSGDWSLTRQVISRNKE
jgi:hypothetical protein